MVMKQALAWMKEAKIVIRLQPEMTFIYWTRVLSVVLRSAAWAPPWKLSEIKILRPCPIPTESKYVEVRTTKVGCLKLPVPQFLQQQSRTIEVLLFFSISKIMKSAKAGLIYTSSIYTSGIYNHFTEAD